MFATKRALKLLNILASALEIFLAYRLLNMPAKRKGAKIYCMYYIPKKNNIGLN
jgi:hypothetical protein